MIAHSLQGDVFGPAQRLHGATYVVEVTLRRKVLNSDGIVVDIGRAGDLLKDVLAPYAYRNLDELSEFTGMNTTTEVLAETMFNAFAKGIQSGSLGEDAISTLDSIQVRLREKPDAWATYDAPLNG